MTPGEARKHKHDVSSASLCGAVGGGGADVFLDGNFHSNVAFFLFQMPVPLHNFPLPNVGSFFIL